MSSRLATRYAKALIDLAVEKNSLEEVRADMLYWQAVCQASRDLVNMLRSPVINGDKKLAVLQKIGQGHLGTFTGAFFALLIRKGRENDLPEIIDAFLEQYNVLKGIHTVRLTTAAEVGDSVRQTLQERLKTDLSLDKVVLETVVDPSLIGGFTMEFDGKMVDASIARDLRDIRKQFSDNTYIAKISK
ncbi:MAG TPA: ATP synthase F1 subunit delta [Dinghuibacter sp.]|uniref:ATP synthase F1 subunit delta n=1 Tax=Dinghuibacter sp. TaxID=2024697 RepID=UPI002B779B43|nr:ATP synthase F1 subunit delta [Dinghuibacter sp.]HTJ13489.1 ATP synthase F1 subunit delta [Dinghuibacter sp.]